MDVHAIQQFATDLRKSLSHKSVVNILGSVFTILAYAEKCGAKVSKVGFTDLEIGSNTVPADVPFFTRRQATLIIEAAREPFKTLFAVAWCTGLRAGEILALTLDDLDFTRKTVRVNKSSDDRTREIRQPKTPKSVAVLPMNTSLGSQAPRIHPQLLEAEPISNSVSESDRRSPAFTRQRGADRIEACLEEARDSRERRRAPRLSSRPCDRTGRGRGTVNRSAAAASTRRHQDDVETVQPRDPGIATRGYGADRWIRIPIITIFGIITEVRA